MESKHTTISLLLLFLLLILLNYSVIESLTGSRIHGIYGVVYKSLHIIRCDVYQSKNKFMHEFNYFILYSYLYLLTGEILKSVESHIS